MTQTVIFDPLVPVAVLGLRVAPANPGPERPTDETSQLSVRRVYVDVELSSLLHLAPVVGAVIGALTYRLVGQR